MSLNIRDGAINDLLKHNKQITNLAVEVVTCRGAMQRLESLKTNLRHGDPKTNIHLCDEMRSTGIPEMLLRRSIPAFSQRVQRTIAVFVQQRLTDELRSRMDPHQASTHNYAVESFMAKIQDSCVECFARAAAISSATTSKSFDDIRSALVSRMDEIWANECVPFIEMEKRAMLVDAKDIAKLLQFMERVQKQPDRLSKACTWANNYDSIVHISERIRGNPWYTSSFHLWPLDRSAMRCAEWASEHGDECATSLSFDQQELLSLSRKSSSDPAWIGLSLKESIATPQQGFMLLPPSHLNGFDTDTKRLFIVPDCMQTPKDGEGAKQWNLLPIQMVWILRELLRNNWFPIGGISNRYAEAIVSAECNELADKIIELLEVLQESTDAPPGELERVLSLLEDEISDRLFPASQHGSGVETVSDIAIQECVWKTQQSSSNICFLPRRVSSDFVIDYVVIHAAHLFVSQSLQQSRGKGVAIQVSISIPSLAVQVSRILTSRTSILDLEANALKQIVPRVVNKLIAFGKVCCKNNLIAHAANVEWYAEVVGKRNKELVVGRGSFDRSCDIFCQVCALVKCHLDENHPLPGTLDWIPRRKRS